MSLRDKMTLVFTKELVDVEEWGLKVEVRPMSLADKSAIALVADGHDQLVSRIVAATCFDPETGDKAFVSDDDLAWLRDQPAGVVERVASVGTRVSGLGGEDKKVLDNPKGV